MILSSSFAIGLGVSLITSMSAARDTTCDDIAADPGKARNVATALVLHPDYREAAHALRPSVLRQELVREVQDHCESDAKSGSEKPYRVFVRVAKSSR